MATDKPRPTIADYVTIALSPALIVAMIVSLLWFLVTVLYRGDFVGRLQHILFFFTFGMVLVARISMEIGISERAPLYGIALAGAVLMGMGSFVDYPPELAASSWLINVGLIALVWWLSFRLTYSCTYIDEQAEATGTGVLQAAGLDDAPGEAPRPEGKSVEPDPGKKNAPPPSSWQRYKTFREEQKKKTPPGVWVVYFGLAALPIFGLGQSLIDPEDFERRSYTFWLMALYAASSLGLLVTTAFLGLRRYLRQRNVQMPAAMAGVWLAVGGGLVLGFVSIAALLPRPEAEFSVFNLTQAGSKARDASKHAVQSGDPSKGEGRPGAQKQDPQGDPVNSKDPNREGEGGKGEAKGKGAGAKGEQKGGANEPGKQNAKAKEASSKQQDGDTREKTNESKAGQQSNSDNKAGNRSGISTPSWLAKVTSALKWIVFAVLAVATVIFVLRGGLRYLANFADWARRLLESLRRFWEGLFGGARPKIEVPNNEPAPSVERGPFKSFSNPFHDGRAAGMLPTDLVRYSFEALETWAQDRDLGRAAEETPIEFADRVADESPGLGTETKRLGVLFARVLYAQGGLPSEWRGEVETFWECLDADPAPKTRRLHRMQSTE